MVKVDAAVQDANQHALTLGSKRVRNGAAGPNTIGANPFGTRIGIQRVVAVFQDFADAGHAFQVFSFLSAQLNGDAVQNYVINIADLDGTPQQILSLEKHRLAIDSQAVQVVLALNAVDSHAAFGAAERSAFKKDNISRDFCLVDNVVRLDK